MIYEQFVRDVSRVSPYLTENKDFMKAILMRLKPQVCSQRTVVSWNKTELVMLYGVQVCLLGDAVVTTGETGREMYFVSKGIVEVLFDDPSRPEEQMILGPGGKHMM